MNESIANRRVAILATDGFEQSELEEPLNALKEAGAKVSIVSPKTGEIQGMHHAEAGDRFPVDIALEKAREKDFDALMLPGGLLNPDLVEILTALGPDALAAAAGEAEANAERLAV